MSSPPNSEGAQVAAMVHPPGMRAPVTASLAAELSPEATRFLSAAAVIDAHFVLDDVAEVLGVPPGSLVRPLQEIMSTPIVVSAGPVLAFRNEEIRDEVCASLPESVRVAPRRRMPTQLLDRVTHPVRDSAPRAAADVARHSLDLTTVGLRLELALTLVLAGDNVGAIREAETVVAQPGLPVAVYAAAESARVLALLSAGTFGAARRSAEAILAGEGRHGGDVALAGALTVLSISAWTAGNLADALSLMRGAVGRAGAGADAGHRAFLRAALCRMQIVTGERAALSRADDGSSCGGEHEIAPWRITLAFFRSRDLLDYGDVDGAIEASERALALATGSATQFLVPMVHAVMATISLLRDDPGDADAQLELARSDLDPLGSNEMQNRLVWIRARVLDATGGPSAALECLERVCADITAFVPMLVEEPGSAAWFVRLALSQGDEARARIVAFEAEQLLADNRSFPCIHAIALHVRGLLDRDADTLDRAAAMHWQPWARASATEDAGVVLDDLGRREASRAYLERAISGYAFAGSERDAKRVRSRLHRTAHARREPAGRPVEGWASLTRGELRVVSLVAQGLTNRAAAERAFLSRHTVDSHLRQAFRKLNISSRVELVRFALEHERETS